MSLELKLLHFAIYKLLSKKKYQMKIRKISQFITNIYFYFEQNLKNIYSVFYFLFSITVV